MSNTTSPLDDVRRVIAEAVTFYTTLHTSNVLPARYAVTSLAHLAALDTAATIVEQMCNEAQHKEQAS